MFYILDLSNYFLRISLDCFLSKLCLYKLEVRCCGQTAKLKIFVLPHGSTSLSSPWLWVWTYGLPWPIGYQQRDTKDWNVLCTGARPLLCSQEPCNLLVKESHVVKPSPPFNWYDNEAISTMQLTQTRRSYQEEWRAIVLKHEILQQTQLKEIQTND
jgi:hypothetical protein